MNISTTAAGNTKLVVKEPHITVKLTEFMLGTQPHQAQQETLLHLHR